MSEVEGIQPICLYGDHIAEADVEADHKYG